MFRVLIVLLLMNCGFAYADDFSAVEEKLKVAMKSDVRTEAEIKRDRNRDPLRTLEFFGLRDDMTVIELLPGGGWYTKLLAPVLKDNGQLYVAIGTGRVKDADIVFTFRNYHNFGAEGRAAMNRVVFDALKPGGIYAVVDHTRRHMEADSGENRRRMDPVLAIKEIEAAGFEFVDYSDLHFKPDDELRYEVGRKTVTGNTDRWTLKFRKPAN
jgi:predicted methyltransferase